MTLRLQGFRRLLGFPQEFVDFTRKATHRNGLECKQIKWAFCRQTIMNNRLYFVKKFKLSHSLAFVVVVANLFATQLPFLVAYFSLFHFLKDPTKKWKSCLFEISAAEFNLEISYKLSLSIISLWCFNLP